MAQLNFQQPLLQSLVSHDPLEIIIICWFAEETFPIVINIQTIVLPDIFFVGNCNTFFRILWWIEEQHLFEIEIVCNIINVFCATKKNIASLHNKTNFFFFFLLTPNRNVHHLQYIVYLSHFYL